MTRDTQRDATFQEVRRLKEENDALKRAVAEKEFGPVRRKRCQQMAGEYKLEALRAVEGSGLPVIQVLAQLQISRSTYYRWRANFRRRGLLGLRDRPSSHSRVWTRYCHQSETKRWRLPCCIRSGRHEKSAGILRTTAGLRSPSPRSIGS